MQTSSQFLIPPIRIHGHQAIRLFFAFIVSPESLDPQQAVYALGCFANENNEPIEAGVKAFLKRARLVNVPPREGARVQTKCRLGGTK